MFHESTFIKFAIANIVYAHLQNTKFFQYVFSLGEEAQCTPAYFKEYVNPVK